ncbi:DUF2059 domain-containing protein [Photobacterium sp. J15]|uniref:DUF2059 domain-containing protein n=1 Tax=Photobacterium sp. J15 TaxID=265901 RepID=UPI0007E30F9C|nr:DUF2059 domain-containing protein [Photobacterium sp. J15]
MRNLSIIAFSLLFFSSSLFADERTDLEQKIAEVMDIEGLADKSVSIYRVELLRLYPSLSPAYLDSEFEQVFEFGKQRYIESYMKGYSVYSDNELRELIKFYETDFGQWYLEKALKFNATAQADMGNAAKDFNDAFIKRASELQGQP